MSRPAVLAMLTFAALSAAPLVAQDRPASMAGKWEFTYSTQRGETKMTVTFEQDGENLKGTAETGRLPLVPAELIEHRAGPVTAPLPGVSVEYGGYLATTCRGCHGVSCAGGLPARPLGG